MGGIAGSCGRVVNAQDRASARHVVAGQHVLEPHDVVFLDGIGELDGVVEEPADVRVVDAADLRAVRVALKEGLAKAGERLVITAGVPFGTPGATNILRIAYV